MSIDIGELVNSNYTQNEVIEIITTNLTTVANALLSAMSTNNWGAVGAATTQLTNTVSIAKGLNQKVNGKKEGVVV